MKKSLSAILVALLSSLGAKALASNIEVKNFKSHIVTTDGSGPGGNGVVRNAKSTVKSAD